MVYPNLCSESGWVRLQAIAHSYFGDELINLAIVQRAVSGVLGYHPQDFVRVVLIFGKQVSAFQYDSALHITGRGGQSTAKDATEPVRCYG